MKPHIKIIYSGAMGVKWRCHSARVVSRGLYILECVGDGYTPKEAYDNWLRNRRVYF